MPRILGVAAMAALFSQAAAAQVEWRYPGGTHAFDRYSPAAQIDKSNVSRLKLLWARPGVDPSILSRFPDISPAPYLRGTPIMIGDTLYAPDALGLVEAFDALTGATRWVQQPAAPTLREVAGTGTRGVDYWRSGADERIISVRGEYLYALTARDGTPIANFGEAGRVLLRRKTPDNTPYSGMNGPIVVGDVIVIGGNGGGHGSNDSGPYKEAVPEDIRGYDVRSGKLLWTFHILPHAGEPGHETWGLGSADYAGNMGAWAQLAADDTAGIVYVPLSAPGNSHFGGLHPGNNLYANSLLALDAHTGKLLWHYQLVHHDLWDFDNAAPPTLARLKINGRPVDAVIQANKNGSLFVFDRKTGKPVWPIEERPVPASTVPGEAASPTQPFPTRPAPIERQGISEKDLIDFTPELNAQARAIAGRYVLGPLFTPPMLPNASKRGVLALPSSWGSANWNNGAFDPETGRYYAVAMAAPSIFRLAKPIKADATIPLSSQLPQPDDDKPGVYGIGPQGLPLVKPPYGSIVAYDMNRGEKLWTVANGDGPRNAPALKGLNLPPLGTIGRPAPLLTKTLLFVGESSNVVSGGYGVPGASIFRAYDKTDGRVLAQLPLPSGATGAPITYVVGGRQIIVVPIGSRTGPVEWVAMGVEK